MSPVAVRRGYPQPFDIAHVAVCCRGSVAVRRGYSQVLEIPTVAVPVVVCAPNPPYPPVPLTPLQAVMRRLIGLSIHSHEDLTS
jgi:hypothetical protein